MTKKLSKAAEVRKNLIKELRNKAAPKVVEGEYKSVFVDVDGTLVNDTLGKTADELKSAITVNYVNGPLMVLPREKNIELVKLFYRLGYRVIIWSRTGREYARIIAEAVGLKDYASGYESKPMYIIDDEPPENWIGERRGYFDKKQKVEEP